MIKCPNCQQEIKIELDLDVLEQVTCPSCGLVGNVIYDLFAHDIRVDWITPPLVDDESKKEWHNHFFSS